MLLGLLVNDEMGLLSDFVAAANIRIMSQVFIQLVVVTSAMTILIGIVNLLFVHLTRMIRGRGISRVNSLVLILSFLIALLLGFSNQQDSMNLLQDVQVAIESSLAALLFFALVLGAGRILQRRVSFPNILFVLSILLVLVGSLSLPGLAFMADLRDAFLALPVSAGARGIILGIALATLVTGLRVLIGQDRSYGE